MHWTRLALCTPVSAIGVVGWLTVAPAQLATTWWQLEQLVEYPAAVWFGLVVATYSAWWQPSQVCLTVEYGMVVWHWVHCTRLLLCAPVSAIGVVGWLKVAPAQLATTW